MGKQLDSRYFILVGLQRDLSKGDYERLGLMKLYALQLEVAQEIEVYKTPQVPKDEANVF